MKLSEIRPFTDPRERGRGPIWGICLYLIVFIAVYTIGLELQKRNFLPGLLFTELVFIAGPSYFVMKRCGIDIKPFFSLQDVNLRILTKTFNLSLLGVVGILLIASINNYFFDLAPVRLDVEHPALFLLISCTVIPFCEELMFRGGIQSLFMGFGLKRAIVYTALLFAVFHGDVVRFQTAFIIGAVCGYLVGETKSLFPAIQAHGLINLSMLLIWKGVQ